MLLRTPGASFFHSSAWARVLSDSYGYTPFYFWVAEKDNLRALVPLMEVNSFLTGKRGVSLPFTDYCNPILDRKISFQDLFDQIIEFGKGRGWKHVELRSGNEPSPAPNSPLPFNPATCNLEPGSRKPQFLASSLQPPASNLMPQPATCNLEPATGNGPLPVFVSYIGHTLDLTKGEKAIYSGLRDSTRRNIKKAEKEKVEVRIEKTGDAMYEFCRLNRLTRREHGLPPQPFHFFEKVHRDIISEEGGFIAIAYFQGKAIAGNVYFYFGDQGIYKYGASDRTYQDLRANNLVMWEAIKWFAGEGCKSLCFGRTEMENQGLQQFKSGWGPEEYPIRYYRYDLRENAFVPGKKKGAPVYAGLFRATPIPVLNAIGSLFYRHMG